MSDTGTELLRAAAVFFGGGVGSLARYGVGRWLNAEAIYYWPTFGINVLGSFLLGLLVVTLKDRPTLLLLLGTGFCGGFTTFSTFSVEALNLLQKDQYVAAFGYTLGSVLLGLTAAWAAQRLLA